MNLRPADGPRSKRGLILDAAIESFGRDGFEHTKWASVADDVGIGQTALYHYFESKYHCLLTIMSLELERSLRRFQEAVAGMEDDRERLRAAVRSAYDVSPSEALAARIVLSHMDELTTRRQSAREELERRNARALVRKIEDEWSGLLARGMEHGVFTRRDLRLSSLAVLSLMIGVWRWYRPGGELTLPALAQFTTEAAERLVLETPLIDPPSPTPGGKPCTTWS